MNFVMFLLKDEEARRLARTDDMDACKNLTLLEKKKGRNGLSVAIGHHEVIASFKRIVLFIRVVSCCYKL